MEKSNPEETQKTNPVEKPEHVENLEETLPWRPEAKAQEISLEEGATISMPVEGGTNDSMDIEKTQVSLSQPPAVESLQPELKLPSDQQTGYEETTAFDVRGAPDVAPTPVSSPVGSESIPTPEGKSMPESGQPTAPPIGSSVGPQAGPRSSEPAAPPIPPQASSGAAPKPARRRGLPWFFFPILGLAILLGIFLLSAFGGYTSGIALRKGVEKTQVAQALEEQFQLGLQDMQQGEYYRARQRFEYVVELDPNYPGVTEKLAEVLLELSTTATPTLLPNPTESPTPDLRDNQQLFDQAQQAIAASDWAGAIDSLLALRKADPAFRAVEVDGLLFLALRNQGRDKILKESDLEGGIYDLTLAGRFGPLDAEAEGLLNWSSLYITGASFWGIDWEQAVNYFSQVAPQTPNLMDGSKMTATERLRIALFEYGNVLAGRGQFCKAVRAYQDSIAIAPDSKVQQAGELAAKGCAQGDQPETTPKPGKKPKGTQVP